MKTNDPLSGGVYSCQGERPWKVKIRINGWIYGLGYYSQEKVAAKHYETACNYLKMHGEEKTIAKINDRKFDNPVDWE